MKEEIKNSLLLKIFKCGILLMISWFIVLIIFSMLFSNDGEIPEKYNKFIVLGGILLAASISFIRDYNIIQSIKAKIPKVKSDIESVKKMRDSLINKANRVTGKYIVHEANVFNNFAEARKSGIIKNVKSANEFKTIIESYPELMTNNAIMKLLEQLDLTERRLLQIRTDYSSEIAKYNTQIHSFPFSLVRKLLKLEDIEMENEIDDTELVSDEELGI